jgi:HlyD family secretion protein
VARLHIDIEDSQLKAARGGRVQYRIAEPGEVIGAGGKVLNLVDLSDVYMTFFLPEQQVVRVALGAEVRLVIDAIPQYVLPAEVSYVASVAQFTPKTVETANEREKLMFRVKARLDPELLRRHLTQVKTGVPGVAYLRLDPDIEWPANLALKVPQ